MSIRAMKFVLLCRFLSRYYCQHFSENLKNDSLRYLRNEWTPTSLIFWLMFKGSFYAFQKGRWFYPLNCYRMLAIFLSCHRCPIQRLRVNVINVIKEIPCHRCIDFKDYNHKIFDNRINIEKQVLAKRNHNCCSM